MRVDALADPGASSVARPDRARSTSRLTPTTTA